MFKSGPFHGPSQIKNDGEATDGGVTSNERMASNDEAAINKGEKSNDGVKSDERLAVDDLVANQSRKVLFDFF